MNTERVQIIGSPAHNFPSIYHNISWVGPKLGVIVQQAVWGHTQNAAIAVDEAIIQIVNITTGDI